MLTPLLRSIQVLRLRKASMAILTLNTRSRCASPEAAKVIHPVSLFLRQARRHRNGVISILRLALSTCVLAGIALTSHVLAQGPSEYQVKAAFLYNFAKFIEWPSGTFTTHSDPIVIGIVGDDPFGGVIEDTIRGKTVNGRSLAVRRFRPGQDLKTCHILFVSSSEGAHVSLILESLKGSGILTVGDRWSIRPGAQAPGRRIGFRHAGSPR